jgi:hypothetical protein
MREDAEGSAPDQADTGDDAQAPRRAVGTARLLPMVTFGLGTAVLAGVIVGAAPAPGAAAHLVPARVAATAALGGAISELTGSGDTTCCHHW